MLKLLLDLAIESYFSSWAKENNWVILDSSSPETPATHLYASKHSAVVVACPTGKPNHVLVVRNTLKG